MEPPLLKIYEVLGWSVISEELKGNFAQARQMAEAAVMAARQQADPVPLADALLIQGIIYLLQGEPLAALPCFVEGEQLAPADPGRQLLTLAYTNLAHYFRFLFYPSGIGFISLEGQARWDLPAYVAEREEQWNRLYPQVSEPSLRLEASLIYDLLLNLPLARYIIDGQYLASPEKRERQLGVALQKPLQFHQLAEQLSAPPVLLAYTQRVIADLYWRAGYSDQAKDTILQAHDLYQANHELGGVASCWLTYGDWMAAPHSSPLIWNHVMQEGDWSNTLSWVRESQEFGRGNLNLPAAQQAYEEAGSLFAEIGAERGLANLQLRYGYLKALAGDYEAVTECAHQAERGFIQAGDQLGMWLARAHRLLALIGSRQRKEDSAAARAIGQWGKAAGAFNFCQGLGFFFARVGRRWLTHNGDYQRSLACYRLAQALFEQLGAINNMAQALTNQGAVYQLIGEKNAALVAYEQARELFARTMREYPVITLAAWQQALMVADGICEIYYAQQEAGGLARSLDRLQELYRQKPASGEIEFFGAQFSDTLDQLITMRTELSNVMIPLYRAIEARESGDEGQAEQYFTAALRVAQQLGGERKDFLEAAVFRVWERNAEAVAAFKRYLQQGGAAAGFLGHLAERLAADFGPAGQVVAEQREPQTHQFAMMFFTRVQAYAEAKKHLEALEALGGAEWWRQEERFWELLSNCGEIYEGLDQLSRALTYYDQAITAVETRRGLLSQDELKTALVGSTGIQYLYFYAARTALKLQLQARQDNDLAQSTMYAARALAYAERGKARALLDLMAVSANVTAADNPLLYKSRRLAAQLSLWRNLLAREQGNPQPVPNRIQELEQQIETHEQEFLRVENQFIASSDFIQAEVISLAEIQAALSSDTALVEYYFLGDELLAWVVTKDGISQTHRTAVDTRLIQRQIRAFHRACEDRQEVDDLGLALAKTFLEPLAESIQRHTHLLIIPYGPAHLLPFHVLPWQGQPLIVTRTLSYLPSASTLQFLRNPGSKTVPDRLLAIGNPTKMSIRLTEGAPPIGLKPLPAAETEAAFVASLFPQGKALLGKQATEASVRQELAHYPLLHFATHGYLSEETPLLSSILLAEGQALSLYELLGLRLDADLVVLSACSTAQGETTQGDEVLGLTRGLLAAGARAAVVSLWPVHDVSTSLLMGKFYHCLRAGDIPAVALGKAQNYLRHLRPAEIEVELKKLETALAEASAGKRIIQAAKNTRSTRFARPAGAPLASNDYSHPFYWAPFILVGQ